jgi:transposase
MQFRFCPQLEQSCPHVGHCPHLGGAALGTLVTWANTSGDTIDHLRKALDAERERNAKLVEENLRLEKAWEQAKLELKLERQNKFATRQQKQEDSAEDTTTEATPTARSKKRGAPVGHPGWFRPRPTSLDWSVDVPAPHPCPHCQGRVTVL